MEAAERSSSDSEVSCLDYEETELKLEPPGVGASIAGPGQHDRKRAFSGLDQCGTKSLCRSGESPDSEPSRAAEPPVAKAQVVGWPPVRSYRKNAFRNCTFEKVAVDGAPYLRKVDLETCGGYQELFVALKEMFSSYFAIENENKLVDPSDGMEYICPHIRGQGW
ncbi:auxin-responsive protein IAA1-like [Canna indica]|uniref:Auxin-responsive protein n=1 Tax=Canna indica TaxID=4628 RepID=A0AAQ3QEL0_9LILI|nr:auxin-responsive protein IAA1-like [Canna indica]